MLPAVVRPCQTESLFRLWMDFPCFSSLSSIHQFHTMLWVRGSQHIVPLQTCGVWTYLPASHGARRQGHLSTSETPQWRILQGKQLLPKATDEYAIRMLRF